MCGWSRAGATPLSWRSSLSACRATWCSSPSTSTTASTASRRACSIPIRASPPSSRARCASSRWTRRSRPRPTSRCGRFRRTRMFEVRENEPSYARLPEAEAKSHNRYGSLIDLVERSQLPAGESMQINGDLGVGSNPNRYKQHGFHFTADNCIACHACEAACSEKNNLPPHLAFRSVGYVEGGTYPSFTRVNVSMACNHCDDPVCLKGCPTRAYTKHAEYGAVLQDPDICFGCGYCTWVCPYNAPQLDPMEGHVQKCNMCVDRLEVGLKPACVSACLGNALDFGVIENAPARREQTRTEIPGFPTPDITHPNIRFELKRSLPGTMTRTDSQPIKYTRKKDGRYVPELDERRAPQGRHWNLKKLSSRENPLVAFTLVSQAVIGAFTLVTV